MSLLPGIDPLPSEPSARVRASSAWYTPPAVAARMAAMCWRPSPILTRWRILEPSAGGGALISALRAEGSHDTAHFDAVELDAISADRLRERFPDVNVECCDYLARPAPAERFDLASLNPPYEKGADSAFVAKVMDESDRVVALLRLAMLETARAYERVWSRVDSGEWRLLELSPFVERPAFLPGGEQNDDGGKTAFMLVKMSRAELGPSRGTHVSWGRR